MAAPRRPNILMIVTDEERAVLPRAEGYALPARERIAARGTTFERYYTASAQCSSARSVIYTGRHLPLTEIYDNDNMPYIRPLDPKLGTLGTMLRSAGYYCTYQGKWHLSNAYVSEQNPAPTNDALEAGASRPQCSVTSVLRDFSARRRRPEPAPGRGSPRWRRPRCG